MKTVASKFFWQGGIILLAAVVLAFVSNQIRSERLPLLGEVSEEIVVSLDSLVSSGITIDEIKSLFNNREAVFVDIRLPEDYGKGHIPGAKNFPWNLIYEQVSRLEHDIPKTSRIIIYGGAEESFAASSTALVLKDLGYDNVRTFAEGWSRWVEQGLPVEKGK